MVPATAAPGDHTIVAKRQVSGRASAPFTVRTDWPTFHFDNEKTGENPYENVLDPSNVGDLEVAGAADLEEFVHETPVVAGGVVYAVNDLMEVFALDPASGGVIWRRPHGRLPSGRATGVPSRWATVGGGPRGTAMALGDGIRRDIATVSDFERQRFIAAIIKLDTQKFFPDGVSYWDKQEDIHKNAHFAGVDVHAGAGFIPWHRVIVNRLEDLLRQVDPELSLHYWDWTTDPRVGGPGRAALFTDVFMDNHHGEVSHLLANFESTEGAAHPKIWRAVGDISVNPDGTPALASDATILGNSNFATFAAALKAAHDNTVHNYIGGTIMNPHYSFHDPFVFLLHSNLDRIWARWQTAPGHPERLAPGTAYQGLTAGEITHLASELVEPWAGGTGLEPWASDPTRRAVITYTNVSVVTPRCFDTNQDSFEVYEAENPPNTATGRFMVNFNDIPEGERTWRAAVLRVRACEDVALRVKPGTEPAAPFSIVGQPVPVHHGATAYSEGRLWFEFTAGAVGTAPQNFGPINTTLTDDQGHDFDFELRANTIQRPTVAVALALDQSGSMSDPAGISGVTRLQVLQDAASLLATLIQPNNGLGIIRFDQDAYPPNDPTYGGMPITRVMSESFADQARVDAGKAIAAHGAHGTTSVGDGLLMARAQLAGLPAGSYQEKAIIVLTDGLENEPQSIAGATSTVDDRTYAIGLGNEAQVNTQALTAIAGGTGGYLLLTGLLSGSLDNQFRLRKFFMQILAGVTKNSIVRDPIGYVPAGSRLRIPFELNEADSSCRLILLTQYPIVRLAVEAPDGTVFDEASGVAGTNFDAAPTVRTARYSLPLVLNNADTHAGTWHALLELDPKLVDRLKESDVVRSHRGEGENVLARIGAVGAAYCLSVHAESNLHMTASAGQSGYQPGANVNLTAALTEYGLPVERRARIDVEVEQPGDSRFGLGLTENEGGQFAGSFVAVQSGIYRLTFRATGGTFRGSLFSREQIATAAVWPEGDRPTREPGDTAPGDTRWCELLLCLLENDGWLEKLKEWRIDPDRLRSCVKEICP